MWLILAFWTAVVGLLVYLSIFWRPPPPSPQPSISQQPSPRREPSQQKRDTLSSHMPTKIGRGNGSLALRAASAFLRAFPFEASSGILSVTQVEAESSESAIVALCVETSSPEPGLYDGILTFKVLLSEGFPFEPPFVWLVSPQIHSKHVFPNGSICLDILGNNWSPSFSLEAVVVAVRSIIFHGGEGNVVGRGPSMEHEARAHFRANMNLHGW